MSGGVAMPGFWMDAMVRTAVEDRVREYLRDSLEVLGEVETCAIVDDVIADWFEDECPRAEGALDDE
jgi:hypothetical protein